MKTLEMAVCDYNLLMTPEELALTLLWALQWPEDSIYLATRVDAESEFGGTFFAEGEPAPEQPKKLTLDELRNLHPHLQCVTIDGNIDLLAIAKRVLG
jgi:hypothetical protein